MFGNVAVACERPPNRVDVIILSLPGLEIYVALHVGGFSVPFRFDFV